jgi:hypothetical protein
MTRHERCQLAIEILQKTRDGRDLFQTDQEIARHGRNGDGAWLKFIEDAVNGFLNAKGDRLLQALHRQVLADDYRYPVTDFIKRFLEEDA